MNYFRLFLLLALFHFSELNVKAQTLGTCSNPDTLNFVSTGGAYTPITFQIGQMDYFLFFTATNDSLNFDIDTNVLNPAHLAQFTILSTNCSGATIFNYTYSSNESVLATGLVPGQNYFIKLQRGLSGNEGQIHELNIRSEIKTGEYCFTISTGSNTAILVDFYGTGELVYVMPPTSVDALCDDICIAPCEGPFTVLDTAYIWEIIGPGLNLDQFDLLATAGCFTLPVPSSGTATYDINVYYLGDSALFFTTSITIGSIPSPPPLLEGFTGPFCSFQELVNNLDTAVINLDYYPASSVLLNGDPITNYPNTYCPPDSMLLTVNGFTLCGVDDTVEFYVYFTHPEIDASYTVINCNTVQLTSNYTCANEVDSIRWDDNNCFGIDFYGDNPTHTFPYPGVYELEASIVSNCSNNSETIIVNIPGPSGSFTSNYNCSNQSVTFIPSYSCDTNITAVVWDFGDGTTYNGLVPPVHPYLATGMYNVTMTITYESWDYTSCSVVTSTLVYANTINVVGFTGLNISGPNSACSGNTLTYTLTPVSGTLGGSLTGFVVPSTVATISGGPLIGTFVVNIIDPTQDFTLYFVYVDNNGCVDTVTFSVQGCCNPVPATTALVKVVPPGGSSSLFSYFGTFGGGMVPPPTIIYANKTFYFYEDVTIDANHIFNKCNFFIAPGKKIYIKPGKVASFLNCSLTAMCNEMWAGIRMDDPTAKLTFKSSKLYQAEIGLEMRNNPEVVIGGVTNDRSLFKNCYYGIVGYTVLGIQNFKIDATTFTSDFMGLYAPYASNGYTQAGIYLRGNPAVSDIINIGVNSAVPGNFNEFNNLYTGISSSFCTVNIMKNNFKNTRAFPFNPAAGCGVYIEGKFPDIVLLNSVITSSPNYFETCARNGILAQNGVSMTIRNNQFSNMPNASAIHGINNKNLAQTFMNNTITNYRYGINLNGNYNSNISIQNNAFNGALVIPSGFGGEAAIYLNDVLPTAYNADVSLNTINNGRKGIWLVNANSTVLPTGYNSVNVKNNSISFNFAHSPLSTSIVYGIHAERSKDVTIDGNTLTYNNVVSGSALDPVAGHDKNLIGIAVDQSTNTEVVANKLLRFGDGLYVAGACNNSRFGCNNFNRCFNGVYFLPGSGVNVPNQLINSSGAPAPTDNLWTNSTSFGSSVGNSLNSDLAGAIPSSNSIRWYFSSFSDLPTIATLVPGSLTVGIPELTSNPNICPTLKLGIDPIQKRQTNFDDVITNSLVYETSNQKYTSHRNTLNNIKRNNLAVLGLPNDVDYINYVNDQSNTNIGKLQTIEESINNEYFLSADSILNNFIDTNLIESNLKLVYSYYLKLRQGDTLLDTDSILLNELALADPLINGEAVIGAAVLLDLDIPWIISEPKKSEEVEIAENIIGKISVQPNPAKDKITVQFDCRYNEEKYHYRIYNSVGEVLINGDLICNVTNEIDLSEFQNSVFILCINSSHNHTRTFKVIKQ